MFAERGLRATTVRDIADSAGILSGSLYHHFSSKEEILAWLLERLLRDLSVEIGHILDRDELARDRLHAVFGAYLGLFAKHRELCTVLLTELGRITRIPALADAIWASFHEPVRKLLHAGEIDGSLRPIDDDVTASAIFGAVTMVGLHYVVTGQPIDSDAAAGRLDDLLLGGLAPPTRPRTSTKGRKR